MKKRIEEIDSLKGLAAVSVVLGHYLNTLPEGFFKTFVDKGPFRIFVAGNDAVLTFFLFSGFVLALPYIKGKKLNAVEYRDYAIKRVARIYIPYFVSLIIAILCLSLFYTGNIAGLSSWFNDLWKNPITLESVLDHLFFMGEYPKRFNVVIWTLVEEMRISLIFPFLAYFLVRFSFKQNVIYIVGTYLLSMIIHFVFGEGLDWIADTIYYTTAFLVGGLVAKHKDELISKAKSLTDKQKIIGLISGVFLYTYAKPTVLLRMFFEIDEFYLKRINFIFTIAGSVLILLFAIGYKPVSKVLNGNRMVFLGKISFSVYLYHLVIMLSMIYLLNGVLPIWAIFIISFISTFFVAYLSYKYVELPSIEIGKQVIQSIHKPKLKEQI